MKRNRLYTINKGNKNLFDIGGLAQYGYKLSIPDKINIPTNGGNSGGSGGSGINWSAIKQGAQIGAGAALSTDMGDRALDEFDPIWHLAGQNHSAVGDSLSSAGKGLFKAGVTSGNPWLMLAGAGAKVVGGLSNAAFGYGIQNEQAVKNNINNLRNVRFDGNFDDIQSQAAYTPLSGVGLGKVTNGWFNNKGTRKANDLIAQQENALAFANNSLSNAIYNAQQDQLNGLLGNYAAFGGPLDTSNFGGALGLMQQNKYIDAINNRSNAIAKGLEAMSQAQPVTFTNRFDAGGFVDNFMQDPVAAAMNYINQRDAEEAQAEAQAAQEAREQAFADMQTRLMNAETQNQGLQALLEDQNRSIAALQEAQNLQEAAVSPSPSVAVTEPVGNNNTWDYIEGQLRRSGKFNGVQIEGIKYNLQRESALNPYAVGDNGEAFGLGQWHGSRQPKDRSLAGQTQHLIDTLSNYDGTSHWIGRSNYEGFMNARTPEEAHYYITKGYERPAQRILNKVKRDSDMSLRNLRAFGGELGTNGTDFTNGLLQVNAGNTHERNPFGGVPMGLDPQGIPNLVEEGETVFNDYVFSKRLKVPNFMLEDLGLGGTIHKGKRQRLSFADVSKKLAEESEMRPNDPISMNGLQASLSKLMEIQEAERMKERAKLQNREMEGLEFACGGKIGKKYASGGDSNHDYGKNANSKKPASKTPFNWTFSPDIGLDSTPEGEMARLAKAAEDARIANENASLRAAADAEAGMGRLPRINRNNGTNGNNNDYDPYPTWMRYAPAVGAGLFTLTDTLGLTNRPDYTYASKLEAAAERAGYAPNIQAPVIGDYMRYTPLDRLFYANQLQANARATDRALVNTSGGNSGTARAAMIANGYNANNNLGNLYRQAEEYNRAQYERTKEFNRRTNMFNAQMGLEADIANARYRQMASQMGLSGLAQAAAMREQIDARTGAARSANITNFLNSLGNIGRENFALNQINSDRSSRYGARANGTSYYKSTGRAKGGKIQRRKK